MTTYNTGNPVPSSAPKDFYDNAENFDKALNTETDLEWTTRLGKRRKTYHGWEVQIDDSLQNFENTVDQLKQDGANVIANLGFFPPVPYESGLQVDSANFTVVRDGVVYAVQPSDIPLTTGDWDDDQWYPIQNEFTSKRLIIFTTFAEAQAAAATLPDGQQVEIEKDEVHEGRRTRNEINSGAVVFKGGSGIWSVWDFGAKGDGVTDDSQAFRAAAACECQAVLIPWTPNGYKVEGTFETKCRFVGLGKPSINLTVRGGDHRGFWLKSNSGLENFKINRYTAGTSVSGEFNNAWVIGEYFSPLGTEYRDIVVRDMELIGFDGGVGRRSMTGIYGNSSDIEITNLSLSGYISYGLMIHWGGVMDPENVNSSAVTASWHPRRIKINNLRMTGPQPDTGLGCLYISGGHDIDGKNIYTYGVNNPVTIAPGDVGGLVAQGESAQRVLNNIALGSLTLLGYVGTAVTISGVSGTRAGGPWLGANRTTKPSIRIDGLTVSRPQTQSADGASGRAIDIRLIKNVKINGVDIYHELDGYTTNATPAVFVQTSSDVEVTGEINVPFASEVVGSRDVVIDVKARSLRTDYPANHHGVRITSQHATATTSATISAGATGIPVSSVAVDMLPGTEIVLPSSNLVVLTTAAVASSTDPVSIPVTAMPVSLASGSVITINRDCDGVKVRGRLYGFLQNIYCFNSSGGASRNVDIDVISEMSGQYDVYARNVKGIRIDGTFTDSNQTSASGAGNLRFIDECSGIDIADSAVFERNPSGTTKAAYNVYLFGNSEAVSVGGKFYNALTSAINQFDPTGASMRPAIGKCWFAPGLPATITPAATVAKTTTIGEMQIGHGSAAPTTGVWRRGDFVFNQAPPAGGKLGWTCITGGTPGVWKPAGTIDA